MPPSLLITTEALSERLAAGSEPLVLFDLRPAEVFAAGHIPGAVHLNLFGVSLIDTDSGPKPQAQSRRTNSPRVPKACRLRPESL